MAAALPDCALSSHRGVRGSNHLSSTQAKGRFRDRSRPFLILVQRQMQQRAIR
jgi:hypothetical protein